jgi:hypothetical protein
MFFSYVSFQSPYTLNPVIGMDSRIEWVASNDLTHGNINYANHLLKWKESDPDPPPKGPEDLGDH